MFNRRFVLSASVVAAVVLVMGASIQARSSLFGTVNHLTFSGPVALPGVVLSAGSYTFEAGALETHRDIVRVVTKNGKVVYTGFTMPVRRPSGNPPVILLGEAPAGDPTPIVAWYPLGSAEGHEFRYR